MKNEILFAFVFLTSVFVASVSQIMLKSSADRKYKSRLEEYLNPRVVFAYSIFFATTLIAVISYKYIALSSGAILEASAYVYVPVLSYFILKEKLTAKKVLGMVVIITGIIVFSLKL